MGGGSSFLNRLSIRVREATLTSRVPLLKGQAWQPSDQAQGMGLAALAFHWDGGDRSNCARLNDARVIHMVRVSGREMQPK